MADNHNFGTRIYSRLRSLKDTDLSDPTANDFLVYDDVLDKYVLKSAAVFLNVDVKKAYHNIYRVIKGRGETAYGYKWRIANV